MHRPSFSFHSPLLKHLPIRPIIFLPVHLNRLIPAPLIIDIFLILRRVELLKLVRFVVGGDIEGWCRGVAADEEDTLDDGVVTCAEDGESPEEVLARGFKAGEETAYFKERKIRWLLHMSDDDFVSLLGGKRGGGMRWKRGLPIRLLLMKVRVSSSLYL